MGNGKTLGLGLFVIGIILIIAYGIYQGFEEIMQSMDILSGIFIGLIILGLIILIISIIIEQRKDTKETMKDIKKEDLEP
ncbi:MAG: hypothetical protein JSV67_05710 [Thermoplasmatales archaeon]|jgi:uncharacterized membrane protein|nr:MAG: hypothetical protein JSV67_05710 [Thermoplasmatales archaeon]